MNEPILSEKHAVQAPSGKHMSREDYEKYKKHLFHVDGCNYEVQKHNGTESIVLKLTGRGTCDIPEQKPADYVLLSFYKDERGDKPPKYIEYQQAVFLYIPFPMASLENIHNMITTSKKTWVQLFYCGASNKQCYADIHGVLV